MNYHEKYLKYKNKYLNLKELIGGEPKYKCSDSNRIKNSLCDESDEGDDKIICEKKCLLTKLNAELEAWKNLFEWCYTNIPDIHIYCKGGSALGLVVLKNLLDKYTLGIDNKYTSEIDDKYTEFLSLKLIKDWDFTITDISEVHQEMLITEAERLGIQNQGQAFPILRLKKGLMIGDDYLIELSMKTNQYLNDLELPLTNLKFEVNPTNIELFFDIIKMYTNVMDLDFTKLKTNLDSLLTNVIVNGIELVDSINGGLYTITSPDKIYPGELNKKLLELMDQIPINQNDKINIYTMKQFLITQICQPDRLFSRFVGKNKSKSISITRFYTNNQIELPKWLIDDTIIVELEEKINSFLRILNNYINEIFIKEIGSDYSKVKANMPKFYDKMNTLINGINIARLSKDIARNNKDMIKYLLPWDNILEIKKFIESNKKTEVISEELLKIRKESEERGNIKIIPGFDYKKIFPNVTSNKQKYVQFIYSIINEIV